MSRRRSECKTQGNEDVRAAVQLGFTMGRGSAYERLNRGGNREELLHSVNKETDTQIHRHTDMYF